MLNLSVARLVGRSGMWFVAVYFKTKNIDVVEMTGKKTQGVENTNIRHPKWITVLELRVSL